MSQHEKDFSQWIEKFYTSDSMAVRPAQRTVEDFEQSEYERFQEVSYIVKTLLPKLEREVVLLSFFQNKRQREIARMLEISQEMVAYYKKRAIFRVRMWIRNRNLDLQRMEEVLSRWITDRQVNAIMLYLRYHSQDAVAGQLDITQAAVSSRITLGHKHLRRVIRTPFAGDQRAELKQYVDVVSALVAHNSLLDIQAKKPRRETAVVEN